MILRTVYIILIIFAYFMLTAKSCVSEVDMGPDLSPEAKQDNLKHEIKNEFDSDYLVGDRLMVFEEKAVQKIMDFSDYMNIYSDKHTDSLIKQEVREMVYRLFQEQDVPVNLSLINSNAPVSYNASLDGLFKYIHDSRYESLEFVTDNIRILEPLRQDGLERYTGKIGCTISINGIHGNDTALISSNNRHVRILVSRTDKSFGKNNSMLIWQVSLAGIEPAR